jgi:glycosyltransferase involved in cell wall biosynthesis
VRSRPRIEVLLATYNGERFLREQIDSILAQDYQNLNILARDDASTDGTAGVLREYAEGFPEKFEVIRGSPANRGVLDNFLSLMKASTADYICFADQDDVWLPRKVSKSKEVMDQLESKYGVSTPLLVFTDLRIVDENVGTLYPSFWAQMGIDPERIHHINKLLGRGVVTGCTMMINRSLLELGFRTPKEASLHDRWIALLASTMGKAGFVNEQTVLYRQHGANAVGTGSEGTSISLPKRFGSSHRSELDIEEWRNSQQLALALLNLHGDELSARPHKLLVAFRRCETASSRLLRIGSFVLHRFYCGGLRARAAVLSHLWSDRGDGDNLVTAADRDANRGRL